MTPTPGTAAAPGHIRSAGHCPFNGEGSRSRPSPTGRARRSSALFTLANSLTNASAPVTLSGSAMTFLGDGTLTGATSLTVAGGTTVTFDGVIGESPSRVGGLADNQQLGDDGDEYGCAQQRQHLYGRDDPCRPQRQCSGQCFDGRQWSGPRVGTADGQRPLYDPVERIDRSLQRFHLRLVLGGHHHGHAGGREQLSADVLG